jgi:hypothetical protein
MKFVPFEEGIEVNGRTVLSVLEGFAAFKKIPSDILLEVGIGRAGADGLVDVGAEEWIPQADWLHGFSRIAQAVGTGALFGIGLKIPDCAAFPTWVTDVHSAIRSIDVAYHLNHRKHGEVMFDLEEGTMLEGIGHYGYEAVDGQKRIVSSCENPYPCDFDRGIITAMAQRFAPCAWVDHRDGDCRKLGGRSCAYVVTWR